MINNRILAFREILQPLYETLKNDCNSDGKLLPFVMHWGECFAKDIPAKIMFYGRAVNGWDSTWNIDKCFDLSDPDREFNKDISGLVTCSDGWFVKHSQFWAVIKQISQAFYPDDWFKYVSWSNVCKAAPSKGRNPSDRVYNKTLRTNQKIFEAEIKFWSPQFIVLFTGGDWSRGGDWSKDFLCHMNDGRMPEAKFDAIWDDEYPDRKLKVYEIDGVYYIVTLHPMGKKLKPHGKCIIETINKFL